MDRTFETVAVEDIELYVEGLVEKQMNSLSRIVAIARYFHLIDKKDIYIYFTTITGGLGVMDSIKDRIVKYESEEMRDKIFEGLVEPPLGTSPCKVPKYTKAVIDRIETHLPPEQFKKILAGNNHGIPKEAMLAEKKLYEEAESMDEYLVGRHQRKVAELQDHCDKDKVWFEQKITQQVVDYVKSNQEILSAVRDGDTLYVTKIPYESENFLAATEPKMKSYYACHCPFAREAILKEGEEVSANWCYCSGGFAKFPFEVILDRELEVEMLESALKGDPVCRFAIKIGDK